MDYHNAKNNDWLAVNQFTVIEGQNNRRPDMVIFVNGLPLFRQRPDWASAKDDDLEAEKKHSCVAKVLITGSADDGSDWQPHIRNEQRRRDLARRFKESRDPFRIVIVRDRWLAGLDAPCLHKMYSDKPMHSHGLMAAIARVNRVFRDKPSGLVVDYLGLVD